jgi:N utilization substance protein A
MDETVQIKAIAREPGHRTKIAVTSNDARVDAVGACVGVRGARIKNIVDELGGERVDIIRWHDNLDEFIRNALKPAGVISVEIDEATKRARVLVAKDQLSLAIGKGGQNVRLAARLSQVEVDIVCSEDLSADEEEAAVEGPAATAEPENAHVSSDEGAKKAVEETPASNAPPTEPVANDAEKSAPQLQAPGEKNETPHSTDNVIEGANS